MPLSIGPRPYPTDFSTASTFSTAPTPSVPAANPTQNPQVQQALQNLAVNIFQNGQSQCTEALQNLNKPDDDEDEDNDEDDAL